MAIPKRIFTIWLNDRPTPRIVERCLRSQNLEGYEHRVITLDNVHRGSEYVNRCIAKKEWVRAADYLRLFYLDAEGGIYLDADTEMNPCYNFDHLLDKRMFVFREKSRYLNNGFIGSEANHPWLKYVLRTMEGCFHSDSNLFLPGMQFFTDSYYMADRTAMGMEILDESEIKKLANHHGMESWLDEKQV